MFSQPHNLRHETEAGSRGEGQLVSNSHWYTGNIGNLLWLWCSLVKQAVWEILSEYWAIGKLTMTIYFWAHCTLWKHTWNFTFFLGILSKTRICSRMFRTLGLMFGFFITSWIFWIKTKPNKIKSARSIMIKWYVQGMPSWKHSGQKSCSTHRLYSLLKNCSLYMRKTLTFAFARDDKMCQSYL